MDQQAFRNLVSDEIKQRTDDMKRRYLADNPERWIATIEELRNSVAAQVAGIDARLGAERFGRHVDARLAEVRERFADAELLTPVEREVRMLRLAIETHRRLVAEVEDTEAIDDALYAVLQGQWQFPEAA